MIRTLVFVIAFVSPVIAVAEGGETIETATVIPGIPYADSGNTCENQNDYDAVCPYAGSSAPDVVYAYTPDMDMRVRLDLCPSLYDTKIYVYADHAGNLVACNDDGCPDDWVSHIGNLQLEAGTTYYVVIDGYGEACGEYALLMEYEAPPCSIECQPGWLHEGEPPCQDGYVDTYNSGCLGSGWTAVEAQDGECADLCGKSCCYRTGIEYGPDCDWYRMTAAGGIVTATVEAEFFVELDLVYVPDCANLQSESVVAYACHVGAVQQKFPPGQEFWMFAAPHGCYSGLPESNYHLHVCGIQGGSTPTLVTSWGHIKNTYRSP